jgi:phage head maturation protease
MAFIKIMEPELTMKTIDFEIRTSEASASNKKLVGYAVGTVSQKLSGTSSASSLRREHLKTTGIR